MTFTADLNRYAKKTKSNMGEAKQAIVFNLFGQVMKRTPVDTGRAKNSWMVTENTPAVGVSVVDSKTPLGTFGPSSLRELGQITERFTLDILANNLPYIEKLEFGSSGQAPAGMVRVTLTEFDAIARKEGWS